MKVTPEISILFFPEQTKQVSFLSLWCKYELIETNDTQFLREKLQLK